MPNHVSVVAMRRLAASVSITSQLPGKTLCRRNGSDAEPTQPRNGDGEPRFPQGDARVAAQPANAATRKMPFRPFPSKRARAGAKPQNEILELAAVSSPMSLCCRFFT